MRLANLQPQWIIRDGARCGFLFRRPTDPDRWMSCFPDPPPEEEQAEIITQLLGDADVSLCPTEMRFSIEGGITNAEFDTLTLTPLFSGQGWTGAIAKGEMIAAPS